MNSFVFHHANYSISWAHLHLLVFNIILLYENFTLMHCKMKYPVEQFFFSPTEVLSGYKGRCNGLLGLSCYHVFSQASQGPDSAQGIPSSTCSLRETQLWALQPCSCGTSSLNMGDSSNEKLNKQKSIDEQISQTLIGNLFTLWAHDQDASMESQETQAVFMTLLWCQHGIWDLVLIFSHINIFYFNTRKTVIYCSEGMHQDSCIPFSVKISRYDEYCFY